jgi:IclR family acetate operon transcriptional repressor
MRPVGLALRLVQGVAELQPISASEIARRLDLPKATVHRLLLALEHFGWLERDGGTRPLWSVSMKPIAIGGRAIERKSGIRIAALSIMDALRRATGETIHLGLLDGDRIVLIERMDGMNSVSVFLPVGTSWDLHWSSAGKALLAHLPESTQTAYLRRPLLRRKSETDIQPAEELAAELDQIRTRGFAMSIGVPPASSSSIGTAIFDKRGFPFAGLSITGSSDRLRAEAMHALAPRLIEAARAISIGMSMD